MLIINCKCTLTFLSQSKCKVINTYIEYTSIHAELIEIERRYIHGLHTFMIYATGYASRKHICIVSIPNTLYALQHIWRTCCSSKRIHSTVINHKKNTKRILCNGTLGTSFEESLDNTTFTIKIRNVKWITEIKKRPDIFYRL